MQSLIQSSSSIAHLLFHSFTMSVNPISDQGMASGHVDVAHEDNECALSGEALKALAEFCHEQEQRLVRENEQGHVEEDWQLSQFWYDQDTTEYLANEVTHLVTQQLKRKNRVRVACISCPTLFIKLLTTKDINVELVLFEFDRRFESKYPSQFIFYDYNHPESEHVKQVGQHSFDIVICDPPFISQECLDKVILTMQYLTPPSGKVLLLTGSVMREHVKTLPIALSECPHFTPRHDRLLANEFRCFSNFELRELRQ